MEQDSILQVRRPLAPPEWDEPSRRAVMLLPGAVLACLDGPGDFDGSAILDEQPARRGQAEFHAVQRVIVAVEAAGPAAKMDAEMTRVHAQMDREPAVGRTIHAQPIAARR